MILKILSSAVGLSPALLALASCGSGGMVDNGGAATSTPGPVAGTGTPAPTGTPLANTPFRVADMGTYAEPWALAFAPGTSTLFVTERAGTMKFVDTATGKTGAVSGLPTVDYGGQGGLGDVAFLPAEAAPTLGRRTIYLSWAEAGDGDTRGAAVGRGTLNCAAADACTVEGLKVIWRQTPKVTGRGHYSHRIAFSPDGRYLFIASGERQKGAPAQDITNNLGSIVRLNLDGSAAAGNPFADRGGVTAQIWSYGHRNILGLHFDAQGRLWDLEHGPKGGDELNLVKPGQNYGWPLVSDGDDYDGTPIPDNDTRPDLAGPAITWNPVIAPGDYVFMDSTLFPDWTGQALIAGLKTEALIRVGIAGEGATERARYPMGARIRDIAQAPDGAIWIVEDGKGAKLRRLTPAS